MKTLMNKMLGKEYCYENPRFLGFPWIHRYREIGTGWGSLAILHMVTN
jgi:hypothetical protein